MNGRMNWFRVGLGLLGLLSFVAAHRAAAADATVALWTAPSTQKIFKKDRPTSGALVALNLAAARGETEAGQIVLRPATMIDLTTATVSDLTGPDGARLGKDNIQLFKVGYVYLPRHDSAFPDPLPPLKLPLHLLADQCQPLWVSARVPEGTAPGLYKGEINLTLAGGPNFTVPLELTVWGLDVPVKPTMRTAFGIDYASILRQHGVTATDPKAGALKDAYFECLLAHRISPYFLPVDDVTTDTAARYLDDARLTSFVIPYSDDAAKLRQTVDQLRQHGRLEKGFFYVVDEPSDEAAYTRLKEVSAKIKAIDPKLKLVSPFFCDPKFAGAKSAYEMLDGVTNIWCPATYFHQPEPLRPHQAAGEEVWWYVCCQPFKPYTNLMIDWDGASHRLLFWQQRQARVTGELYWNTTYWNETRDPWSNAATYTGNGNWDSYGDGSLLYPGDRVGIDGPVSSIRLELARDGAEDYELLQQYGAKFGEDNLQTLIARVSRGKKDYDTDPAKLEAVRRELAEKLTK